MSTDPSVAFSSIVDLAKSTIAELEVIWKECGHSSDFCEGEIENLKKSVEDVYKRKLENEYAVRDEYKRKIEDQRTRISGICTQLKIDCTDSLETEATDTLINQLQILSDIAEKYEDRYTKRMQELTRKLQQLHSLWNKLEEEYQPGFETIEGDNDDLGPSRDVAIDDMIKEAQQLEETRRKAIDQLTEEATTLLADLVDVEEPEVLTQEKPLPVSKSVVEALDKCVSEFSTERTRRVDIITNLGQRIHQLWTRLQVPEASQQAFFATHKGYSLEVITACEGELQKLEKMKLEQMGAIVSNVRKQIQEQWDFMQIAQDEREKFLPFNIPVDSTGLTESVLDEHEAELNRLVAKREKIEPLMKLVNKRTEYMAEKEEYEAIISDSSRLLSRRSSDRRREELLEKHIKKELPRIVMTLVKKIKEFEMVHGTFTVEGKEVLPELEEELKKQRSRTSSRIGMGTPKVKRSASKEPAETASPRKRPRTTMASNNPRTAPSPLPPRARTATTTSTPSKRPRMASSTPSKKPRIATATPVKATRTPVRKTTRTPARTNNATLPSPARRGKPLPRVARNTNTLPSPGRKTQLPPSGK